LIRIVRTKGCLCFHKSYYSIIIQGVDRYSDRLLGKIFLLKEDHHNYKENHVGELLLPVDH
jgi:hypothetical protein